VKTAENEILHSNNHSKKSGGRTPKQPGRVSEQKNLTVKKIKKLQSRRAHSAHSHGAREVTRVGWIKRERLGDLRKKTPQVKKLGIGGPKKTAINQIKIQREKN